MTRFGILFLMALFSGVGLGGCSSGLQQKSSIGDRETLRIGRAVTPQHERNRLIRSLTRLEHTHRRKALREIEAR